MKNHAADLWNDLRARRLWPVALVLLAALVAVPILLSKPAEEPPAAAASPTEARTAAPDEDRKGLATVTLVQHDGSGSALDTFDPRNPFRPPSKVLSGGQAGSGTTSDAGPGTSPPASGDDGSGQSGGGGGGGTDNGSGNGNGNGNGDGSGDGGSTPAPTYYTYLIDVTFVANGRTRRITGLKRLDMIPNVASPMLIFLGATDNGGNAVFAVDASLTPDGEGACKPSKDECAYLYLGPGSKHNFTNEDGDSYVLRIDEIRKVQVDSKSAAASGASNMTSGDSAGAQDGR